MHEIIINQKTLSNFQYNKVSTDDWNNILMLFRDASIYQTTEYAKHLSGGQNLEHFVVKVGEEIVAAALVRIIRIPVVHQKIGYIYRGPLWQKEDGSIKYLEFALKALKQEYIKNRKMILKIVPNIFINSSFNFQQIFKEMGFKDVIFLGREKTFILDLTLPGTLIRKNFRRNWRNHLNRAERNNLKVIVGYEDELFKTFIKIFQELISRKKFDYAPTIDTWFDIQKELPIDFKMRIFICYHNDSPIAGVVCSVLGDTGIYLLGATTIEGMKLKGSYILQWHIIQWLKSQGFKWYDLGGINPQKNPGVYHFKEGMRGKEVTYLGYFESLGGNKNRYLNKFINLGLKFKRRD